VIRVAKKWIAEATKNSHGQFRKKATKAGKSTAAYANEVLKPGSHASTKTKRQANLAKTLGKVRKHK